MQQRDTIRFVVDSLRARRGRAVLTALGIAIGVAAVVLLTSIGSGVQQFVLKEFTQFGTNIIAVQPGRSQTFGGSPGAIASTRAITLEDALALERVPNVVHAVPMVQGSADVEGNGRVRRTLVNGTGSAMAAAFRFDTAIGTFLPPDDPTAPRAVVVLGSKTRTELFGDANPLGASLRVGGERYRIVGAMAPKGTMIGIDLDDTVYIPVGRAMALFNRVGLFEIDILYAANAPVEDVVAGIRRVLIARHGREDFTIITQQEMLDTLGKILNVLTTPVGALGGISLLVGGVGIFTIMSIAVRERTSEIGLLRALGATRLQIQSLFLGEAVLLSAIGGIAGLLAGIGVAGLLTVLVPALPVSLAPFYILVAEAVAVLIGLASGVLPALRAAQLEPVDALRAE
jgi:putative ABC transport system permease protein